MIEQRLAKFISYIFHPIFIPTYGVLIILNINFFITPIYTQLLILGLMIITSVIFPLLVIYIYNREILFNSLEMKDKEDRNYTYLILTITYFIVYVLFFKVRLPIVFHRFLLGIAITCMVVTFINFRYKISIHMVGIGGLTGALIGISNNLLININLFIIISIFLAGIIGYSRLYLNSHKPSEVYTGFITGLIILFFCIFY